MRFQTRMCRALVGPVLFFCFSLSVEAFAQTKIQNSLGLPMIETLHQEDRAKQAGYTSFAAWQSFVSQNGAWTALWNESTGTPHRAFGKGIAIPGYAAITSSNVEAAARTFVSDHSDLFGTHSNDLQLVRAEMVSGKWYVTFAQFHHNIPVHGALVELRITLDGRVFCFGSDGHANINVSAVPSLSEAAALFAAQAEFDFDPAEDRATGHGLVILPMVEAGAIRYHLAYRVRISIQHPRASWEYFIDAHSGEILWRSNLIHAADISGQVKAMIIPEYYNNPPLEQPLRHAKVFISGVTSGATDINGNYNIEVGQPGTYNLLSSLKGLYAEVSIYPSSFSVHNSPVTTGTPHNWTWDANTAQQDEINAYYHVTRAHDFLKTLDPSFVALDVPIKTFVKRPDGGAYYDGGKKELHFDAGNQKHRNPALFADIIIHEYFHGVTDLLYEPDTVPDPPAFVHEALSDYFAATMTNDSYIADGGYLINGDYLRDLEEDRVTPNDWNPDSAHVSGLILAGALWDLRTALGQPMTDELVHRARKGFPRTFKDHLVEILTKDDDNGDISDGTPHSTQIYDAFGRHGITLSSYHLTVTFSQNTLPADGGSVATVSAHVYDQNNNLIPSEVAQITFRITSGASSGLLLGPNPVTPSNGFATIALQSTMTPGNVTIEASAGGIQSGSATILVSGAAGGTRVSGDINSNTTWSFNNSPYIVTDDVRVRQGVILTIEAGVTVRFDPQHDIYVDGILIAEGLPTKKIVFTANGAAPFPGYWGGIKFNYASPGNLSKLNHCQFFYAGQNFYSEAAPIVLDARVNPSITNITLANNARNGVRLAAGSYRANLLLNVVGLPYFIQDEDFTVEQSYTMTIAPGVILKFGNERDLNINGALVADGNPQEKIIFTSLADDAHGGDTNGDGASVPTPGSWGGIRFNYSAGNPLSTLDYCEIDYGGQNFYSEAGPLTVDGRVSPRITNTVTQNNKLNGVRLLGMNYTSNVLLDVTALPYFLINDDMTMAAGATLTIKPGVTIKFDVERDLYVNGALEAKGAAAQPIVFTSLKDDAHGGDSNGDGNTLPAAGNWGGVRFNQSNIAQLSGLDYCEFLYGGQNFYSEASPLSVDPRINPAMAHLKFIDNRYNGIRVLEGTYTSNMKLDVVVAPYFLLSEDLVVSQGATLTVAPGVILKFAGERDLYVRGALNAVGNADAPITFTAITDDAHGGDTNNDGATAPAAGSWGGVRLEKSNSDQLSALSHCQFYYGGQDFYSEYAPLTIDPRTHPQLTNLTLDENASNGVELVSGVYQANLFLDVVGTPYTLRRDDLGVAQGSRLTIAPGVILKFAKERDLQIQGALIANGTEQAPIIFTSIKEDGYGGDTNNDDASVGVPGDWGGIRFHDSSDDQLSSLDYCALSFGGEGRFSEQAMLVFDNAGPKVQNSSMAASQQHGVLCYNQASPDFGGGSKGSAGQNGFLGFDGSSNRYAFYNDGAADVYAKFNYWSTTDLNTVRKLIYDRLDNASKGLVIFEPIRETPTAVTWPGFPADALAPLPEDFGLGQNYPNPFNPETAIEFALPRPAQTRLRVLNVLGLEVRTLVYDRMPPGFHRAVWDGKDQHGNPVPSGVYFFQVQAEDFAAFKKCLLVR